MSIFVIGLIIFFGVHLIPMTPLKPALRSAMGANPYKGVFSLVSAIGLGLIIWGFAMSRSGPGTFPLYIPDGSMRHVTMLMTLAAFICLGAFHGKGYLKLWLRNPMSVGIALWAGGHLLSNGRQAAVIMFSCFLAYALLDIIYNTLKGNKPSHEPRIKSDILAVVIGVAVYAAFLWLHQYLIGIPLI
jgi:uncharacterized membrane protein